MKNTDFWENRNVLITGITGFVGNSLAKKIEKFGAHVYGISRVKIGKNILRANITDYKIIDLLIREKKISVCYHLAGESLVEAGQEDPYKVFKINTQGTLNILESGRKNRLEKIIIASTAHVYGRNRLPYLESYTPKPSRPYETSKACTDLIAQSYAVTFNLPIIIPRFVNIYGPGDINFTRLIPRTIKDVLTNSPPRMWGGKIIRDYLYIDDAIDAYIDLAKADPDLFENNNVFNFGGGNKISVKELITLIIALSNKQLGIEKIDEKRTEEIKSQYVSFSKARKILGWKPKIKLDVGLKITLDWYKKYLARNHM